MLAKIAKGVRAAGCVARDMRYRGEATDDRLWLISERGYDARDNGFAFFSWLCEHHPEIDARYLIRRDSVDYRKVADVAGEGRTVEPGSDGHRRLMFAASALISTHDCGYTPDMVIYHHLAKMGIFDPPGRIVFLQHGIQVNDTPWLYRSEFAPDVFCVSAAFEREYAIRRLGQPADVVVGTGLARYDTLSPDPVARQVLVMPTWRDFLQGASESDYAASEYHRRWRGLLDDGRLEGLLDATDHTLVFHPHPEVASLVRAMPGPRSPRIRVAGPDEGIQGLMCASDVLVTDYSSVFFDMAYMGRPCVFYQFDADRYHSGHYGDPVVDVADFGSVADDPDGVIGAVRDAITRRVGARCPDGFFMHRDRGNCGRIFDAIAGRGVGA